MIYRVDVNVIPKGFKIGNIVQDLSRSQFKIVDVLVDIVYLQLLEKGERANVKYIFRLLSVTIA